MNSGGLPCASPVVVAAAAAAVGPPPGPVTGPGGVKLKFCRYYAKDKTCFYGEECQFLHEEPGGGGPSAAASAACPGPPPPAGLGGLPLGLPPGPATPTVTVAASPGHGGGGGGGYPGHGPAPPVVGPKKTPELGGGGGVGLDGPRLASECGVRTSLSVGSGEEWFRRGSGRRPGFSGLPTQSGRDGSSSSSSSIRRGLGAPEEGCLQVEDVGWAKRLFCRQKVGCFEIIMGVGRGRETGVPVNSAPSPRKGGQHKESEQEFEWEEVRESGVSGQ